MSEPRDTKEEFEEANEAARRILAEQKATAPRYAREELAEVLRLLLLGPAVAAEYPAACEATAKDLADAATAYFETLSLRSQAERLATECTDDQPREVIAKAIGRSVADGTLHEDGSPIHRTQTNEERTDAAPVALTAAGYTIVKTEDLPTATDAQTLRDAVAEFAERVAQDIETMGVHDAEGHRMDERTNGLRYAASILRDAATEAGETT